jgi:hypothetical protein
LNVELKQLSHLNLMGCFDEQSILSLLVPVKLILVCAIT